MSDEKKPRFEADDRGNVVDFYENTEDTEGEPIAKLNREYSEEDGETPYAFEEFYKCDEFHDWLRENGYGYALDPDETTQL